MQRAEKLRFDELSTQQLSLWDSWRAADENLASPYFSPPWVREVSRVRDDVYVGVITDTHGTEIAFLPFQQRGWGVALPVGGALSDYHGLISRPTPGSASGIDLQAALRAMKIRRLDFTHVPMAQTEFAHAVRVQMPSRVIDLRSGVNGYMAWRKERGSSETKRARNRRNKLQKTLGEIRLSCWSGDEDAMAQLLQWKQDQYVRTNQPDVFAHDWTRTLVTNLHRLGKQGEFGGALFLLHAGDQLLAANFCLADAHVVHAWFIAHDPALNQLSPGQALFEEMILALGDTDIAEIDLGAGDYRFKLVLSNRDRELGGGYVAGSVLAGAARGASYGVRNLCEKMPLGRFSELPGKAMRRLDTLRGLS